MSASRIKGHVLRGIDRLLHSGDHPPVHAGHSTATLSPFLQVLRRLKRLGAPAQTPLAVRHRFESDMAAFRVGFGIGSVQDLHVPTAEGALAARLYRPSKPVPDAPLTLYFHGGGFVMGNLDTHDDACRLLSEHSGMPVLSVDYRLAPEAPFPAAVDDALASAHWALQQLSALGANGLALAGDSAGANLAAVTALHLAQAGQRVRAQLLVYPGTDLTRRWPSHDAFGSGHFLDRAERDIFYRAYLGDVAAHAADPRVSPLRAPVPQGLAPALVVTAGHDMLMDEGLAYAQHLEAAGTPVTRLHFPRLGHGFANLASVNRESRQAVTHIAQQWRTCAST